MAQPVELAPAKQQVVGPQPGVSDNFTDFGLIKRLSKVYVIEVQLKQIQMDITAYGERGAQSGSQKSQGWNKRERGMAL